MKREEIDNKYKWDLTKLYKNNKEWQKDYEFVKNNFEKLASFKGYLNNDLKLKEFLEYENFIGQKLSKLAYYSYLSHDVELNNSEYVEQLGLIENLESLIMSATSFELPELNAFSDEKLNELIINPQFEKYNNLFKQILLNRKHLLSEKEENALSLVNSFAGGFSRVYDEITETDLKMKPILINGKEQELTSENYSLYITNEDRNVRKQAYNNLYDAFKSVSHSTAISYIYYLKSTAFDLKLRNYSSLLEESLYSEQIDKNVYYNLINNVNNHLDLMHRYYALLKKVKNIDDFKFYDTYLSIANKLDKHYSYETQQQIVKDCLSVMGNDYVNNLQKAFDNNWIDVYSTENKSSGGYNFCIYGYEPHVFLNDNGNYNSLSTLAHELGHAMHSVYSNKNQCYEKADVSIFIAEIASTVNEILLNKYLLKIATSKEEKIFLLDQFIKNTKATVFRQTMFSEFEDYAHKLVENDKPISLDILNNEYVSLLKKHFGNTTEIDDKIIYEWIRISHFYRSYYVYKYSTSYVCANYIASNIFNGNKTMLNNYLKLLSSGSSDYPTNLLKIVGIDLTKNDAYNLLFDELELAISKLEKECL